MDGRRVLPPPPLLPPAPPSSWQRPDVPLEDMRRAGADVVAVDAARERLCRVSRAGEATTATYNEFLVALAAATRWDTRLVREVQVVMDDMARLGCAWDAATYAAAITACGNACEAEPGFANDAMALFDGMSHARIPHSAAVYVALIGAVASAAWCDTRLIGVAEGAMRDMDAQRLVTDFQPFHELLRAYGHGAYVSGAPYAARARDAFNDMVSRGILPNIQTLNSLMAVYANATRRDPGMLDSVRDVLIGLQTCRVPPTSLTYCLALQALAHAAAFGDVRRAVQMRTVFDTAVHARAELDSWTWTTLLETTLLLARKTPAILNDALIYVDELFAADRVLEPRLACALVDALAATGEPSLLKRVWRLLDTAVFVRGDATGAAGRASDAADGSDAAPVNWPLVVDAMLRAAKSDAAFAHDALALFDHVVQHSLVDLSVETWSAAVEIRAAQVERNRLESATLYAMVLSAARIGILLPQASLEIALDAFVGVARLGHFEPAAIVLCLDGLLRAGSDVDPRLFEYVLRQCLKEERYGSASVVLRLMVRRGGRLPPGCVASLHRFMRKSVCDERAVWPLVHLTEAASSLGEELSVSDISEALEVVARFATRDGVRARRASQGIVDSVLACGTPVTGAMLEAVFVTCSHAADAARVIQDASADVLVAGDELSRPLLAGHIGLAADAASVVPGLLSDCLLAFDLFCAGGLPPPPVVGSLCKAIANTARHDASVAKDGVLRAWETMIRTGGCPPKSSVMEWLKPCVDAGWGDTARGVVRAALNVGFRPSSDTLALLSSALGHEEALALLDRPA